MRLKYLVINTENDNIIYQTEFNLSHDPSDFGLVKPVVAIVDRY